MRAPLSTQSSKVKRHDHDTDDLDNDGNDLETSREKATQYRPERAKMLPIYAKYVRQNGDQCTSNEGWADDGAKKREQEEYFVIGLAMEQDTANEPNHLKH